tara:strand:+ start:427 stop:558 length:132 start_codon:yes stop_codon:yes gene_type:complete
VTDVTTKQDEEEATSAAALTSSQAEAAKLIRFGTDKFSQSSFQ